MEYSSKLDFWVREDLDQSKFTALLAAYRVALIAKGFAKEWINYLGLCNQDLIDYVKSLNGYGELFFIDEYPPSIQADIDQESLEA